MTVPAMVAFHGKQEVKDFYLARVREHAALDQIRQKFGYWQRDELGEFRGCAVGCTLHSSEHAAYEAELGIPTVLAHLEDGIFESLTSDRAATWPGEFLSAPAVGADLSLVWPKFAIWMLVDPTWGTINFVKAEQCKKAVEDVANLYLRVVSGERVKRKEFAAAAASADADASAAYAYASAAYAAAASAADADPYAAAYASAAYAYAYASAASAAYASVTFAAASAACRVMQADKLLELMAEAKTAA